MVSKGSNGEGKTTKASPQRLDPFEGKGPTVLPDIGDVTVSALDPRTRLDFVADRVREILAPTHGDDLHVSFVNAQLEGGAKVSIMLRHGFITVHWSELTPRQLREMRAILQRSPDEIVRFADLTVMVCKQGVYELRKRFIEEESQRRQNSMIGKESGAALSEELKIKVEEDPRW